MGDGMSYKSMLQHLKHGSLTDKYNINRNHAFTPLPTADCPDFMLYDGAKKDYTVHAYTVRLQSGGKMRGSGRGHGHESICVALKLDRKNVHDFQKTS